MGRVLSIRTLQVLDYSNTIWTATSEVLVEESYLQFATEIHRPISIGYMKPEG